MASCEHAESAEHAEILALPVVTPLRKDVSLDRAYVARVRAIQHIEVRALERGYLDEIFVDEGQVVEAGQKMFVILPVVYRAEVAKARAEAEAARIEYENAKRLADKNIISPAKLALAKANFEKAKAELALAKAHLKFTEIRSPFRGIMDKFHVRLGSLVDEGELLTELSDVSKVWIYFNVPEAEYLELAPKLEEIKQRPLRFRMANGKIFPHVGKIDTIEADFDVETGNIPFRATFPNPDLLLRHGETGTVLLPEPYPNALLIPQKATFEVLEKRYVFVVDDQGKVHQRAIQVAAELPHLFIVSEGVTETDRILLEGLRKVRDGDTIEAKVQDPTEVYEHLEPYAE
ncbi:MAG: efflux RND transporter periplasmic adaptor subunit [Deltaproteobacteria bacterium]|nr:MAG: efflux RND transporter periplasmic adaptor subunit [Deltaproteobacteria bacterium]